MKRILTHIFVVTVNFYILTFSAGLLLMLWTSFVGPVSLTVNIIMMTIALLICILYQTTRNKWHLITIGELIINNTNKENILEQSSQFTISRIPIFLLIQITLILNSNLQDGLGDGVRFNFGFVLFMAIMFSSIYFGLKNFFIRPDIIPILLISGGLFIVGFGFKYSPKALVTRDLMFKIYSSLGVVWILVGLMFKYKSKLNLLSAENKTT